MDDDSSPKNKSHSFSLHSFNDKPVSFHEQKIQEASFGVQQEVYDSQLNPIQTDMEAQKKPLGKLFVAKIKDVDFAVRVPFKIEAIDDTVLIGSFPLVKNKKGKHGIDDHKKGKRRKAKIAKRVLKEEAVEELCKESKNQSEIMVSREELEASKFVEEQNLRKEESVEELHKESKNQSEIMYSREELDALKFVEQQNLRNDGCDGLGMDVIETYDDLASCKHQKKSKKRSTMKVKIAKRVSREEAVEEFEKKSITQSKIMYSRNELEALRYVNIVEQQNLWKLVYNGLGIDVMNEYEDLASCKHHNNIGKKAGLHSTTGMFAGRGTRIGADIIVH